MTFPLVTECERDLVDMLLTDYVENATANDTYRLLGLDLLHRLRGHRGNGLDELPPRPTPEEVDVTITVGTYFGYEERTGHRFAAAS